MAQPGWATDDLAEEWVEPSTSPTHEPSEGAREMFGSKRGTGSGGTMGTVGDKRGTLRSLGHAAPRGLPSFRSPSAAEANARVVSGHNSRPLVPSGEFMVPTGDGLLSPPSSRSSSEGQQDALAIGTCVVNDAVADDRGANLARGVKGKDIFGKNPLEKMFEPPSPPVGSSEYMPPTPSPMPGSSAQNAQHMAPRRVSHPYAPNRPSRLSKSMTPSSNASTMMSEMSVQEGDETKEDMNDQSMATTMLEQEEQDMSEEDVDGGEQYEEEQTIDPLPPFDPSTDLSPLQNGATRFPFTFKAPVRIGSGDTGTGSGSGTGTGSGSATIRGGTIGSGGTNIFDPNHDNAEGEYAGPNHSTLLERHLPPSSSTPVGLSANDKLRLFRSTYDTYTREHLSAIVDSIGVEPSPSPPHPHTQPVYEQSTPQSGSDHDMSDDSRSSKRLRLSPPSPDFAPRDWGKQGMDILSRIKGRPVESITSASPGATEEDQYPSVPLSPPLRPQPPSAGSSQPAPAAPAQRNASDQSTGAKGKHRSNPSTASSGYLRAAEEIFANIRNRAVSESASASALESSTGTLERRPLSETDDNVQSSETDAYEGYDYEQGAYDDHEGRKGWTLQTNTSLGSGRASFRSSPESDRASKSHNTINLSGSIRRSYRSAGGSNQGSLPRGPQRQQQFDAADLNRFVSSTTVPTSTTISTSFIKHAGPRGPKGRAANAGGRGMMMIRPDEVSPDALQGLSAQGGMRYDPVAKRWIRERSGAQAGIGLGRVSEGSESRLARSDERSEDSVDVFAGMSEGSRSRSGRMSGNGTMRSRGSGWSQSPLKDEDVRETSREQDAEEQNRAADAQEEGSRSSNASDAGLEEMVANTTTINAAWSDQSGSSSDNSASSSAILDSGPLSTSPAPTSQPLPSAPAPVLGSFAAAPVIAMAAQVNPPVNLLNSTSRPIPHHTNSAPAIMTPLPSHLAPRPVRSALRNTGANGPNETPGPKKTAVWAADLTPAPSPAGLRSATRSVSFSNVKSVAHFDGHHSGGVAMGRRLSANFLPLNGARGGVTETPFSDRGTAAKGNLFDVSGQSMQNSARTRRIQGLLDDMEDLSLIDDHKTPSKSSRQAEPAHTALAPTPAPASRPGAADASGVFGAKRTLRRSRSFRDNDDSLARAGAGAACQTFLTECSFAVAHDHLVKVITDVQPFEPHWEALEEVDLSGKGLESVAKLKDFLPGLDELKVDDNAISYLTGIPCGVRTLYAAGNRLTALASVDHLRNLQFLDVSRNQLDSVAQLSCLVHLRELKADYNRISSLSGIKNLDSLRKVSVRSNRIDTLDLHGTKWSKLENLDMAENGLGEIRGLENLAGIIHLNLDDNDMTTISSATPLKALRTLRISRNDLSQLDLSHFPKIRTVYADDNRLARLTRSGGERSRLEALSLRSQRVRGVTLSASEVRQLKRLYMSGNEIRPSDVPPMSQLRYLEMAACRFSTLPNLASMPALEVLNVNYNFLETLQGLRGAVALRKVMMVGNRLVEDADDVAEHLAGLRVEELDLRMNPSTLGYYLPLFIPPPLPAQSSSSSGAKNHLKPQTHPNKTGVLLGRPNGTMSNLSRLHASQSFFHQPESENWQEMDREFRRNLPDTWYGRRLLYRGVVMRALEGLRRLDGVDVGEGERKKAGALLMRAGK